MILGISGNFKGHLQQTSNTDKKNGLPGCIFPIYARSQKNKNYSTYPINKEYLLIEPDKNYQIEPEICITLSVSYENSKIKELKATHYTLFNDFSIRDENVKKISAKKNWGNSCKGMADKKIPIISFDRNSEFNKLRIASYIIRDENFYEYTEDCSVQEYTYNYDELLAWIRNTINSQLENEIKDNILSIIEENNYPQEIDIAIGATRYTPYGKSNFSKENDTVIIVLYSEGEHSKFDIKKMIYNQDLDHENLVFIRQKISVG